MGHTDPVEAPRRVERRAAQSRSPSPSRLLALPPEPLGEKIHRVKHVRKGGHKRRADDGRRVFGTACAGKVVGGLLIDRSKGRSLRASMGDSQGHATRLAGSYVMGYCTVSKGGRKERSDQQAPLLA